jgi:hypothetical protein
MTNKGSSWGSFLLPPAAKLAYIDRTAKWSAPPDYPRIFVCFAPLHSLSCPQSEVAQTRSLIANMPPSDQRTYRDAASTASLGTKWSTAHTSVLDPKSLPEDMFVFNSPPPSIRGSKQTYSLFSSSWNDRWPETANRAPGESKQASSTGTDGDMALEPGYVGVNVSTQTLSALDQELIDISPDLGAWQHLRTCDEDLLQALVTDITSQTTPAGIPWRYPLHSTPETYEADQSQLESYKALSKYLIDKPGRRADGHILTLLGTPVSTLITWEDGRWYRTSNETAIFCDFLEWYDSRKRTM